MEDFNKQLNNALRKIITGPIRRVDFDAEFDGKVAKVTVEMCLRHPGCELLTANFNIAK